MDKLSFLSVVCHCWTFWPFLFHFGDKTCCNDLLCPCVALHIGAFIGGMLQKRNFWVGGHVRLFILIVIISLPSAEITPIGIRTSSFENACCPHSGQLNTLFIHSTKKIFLIFTLCQGLFYILWIKQWPKQTKGLCLWAYDPVGEMVVNGMNERRWCETVVTAKEKKQASGKIRECPGRGDGNFRLFKESLPKKMTFEPRPEGRKGVSHVWTQGKDILGRSGPDVFKEQQESAGDLSEGNPRRRWCQGTNGGVRGRQDHADRTL